MIRTIEVPNGMISDVYEIETTPEGIVIEHFLRAEDGLEEIASRACLMILPEAVDQVMAGLRRAVAERQPEPVVRKMKLGFGALEGAPV